MSELISYLVTIVCEFVRKHILWFFNKRNKKENIKDWLKCQKKECEAEDLLEYMDFSNLAYYLRTDIINDAKPYLFGADQAVRDSAKQTIQTKALEAAKTRNENSQAKVYTMVDSVLNMLHCDAQNQLSGQDQFILAEVDRKFIQAGQLRESQSLEALAAVPENNTDSRLFRTYHRLERATYYIKTENDEQLKKCIEQKNRVLIHGMPGIGKTEGVLWYLKEDQDNQVVWLNFENKEKAVGQMAEFFLNTEGEKRTWAGETSKIIVDMLCELANGIRDIEHTVLVFDNVCEVDVLELLSRQKFECRVIIISTLNFHFTWFEKDEIVNWKELDESKGVELFKSIIDWKNEKFSDEDENALQEIVRMSGGLPLVIRQAAVYMGAQQLSPEKYLEQCTKAREMKFIIPDFQNKSISKQELRIYAAYHLPYHELCEVEITENWFLRLFHSILFLNHGGIEETLLMEAAGVTSDQMEDGINRLLKYTLILRKNGKLYMKQIVQDIMRGFLDDQQKKAAVVRIGHILANQFEKKPPVLMNREHYMECGSNIQRFLFVAERENIRAERTAELYRGIGLYYYFCGFYERAQNCMENALRLFEANQGMYLRIRSELAELCEEAGDNKAAENYIAEVSAKMDWLLKNSRDVAVHGLTVKMHLYENEGNEQMALEAADQVLQILKSTETGGNKSYFLTANICKVNIYNKQKRYVEAEEVFNFAADELGLDEHVPGEDIDEATLFESRANTLQLQNKTEEAIDLYKRLISIYLKKYAADNHPLLSYPYINIAVAHMECGNYEAAEKYLKKAEVVLKKNAFVDSNRLMTVYFYSAMLAYNQGQYEKSYSIFRKAVYKNCAQTDEQLKNVIEGKIYLMMACAKMGMKEWETAYELFQKVASKEEYEEVQRENAKYLIDIFAEFRQRIEQGEKIENLVHI